MLPTLPAPSYIYQQAVAFSLAASAQQAQWAHAPLARRRRRWCGRRRTRWPPAHMPSLTQPAACWATRPLPPRCQQVRVPHSEERCKEVHCHIVKQAVWADLHVPAPQTAAQACVPAPTSRPACSPHAVLVCSATWPGRAFSQERRRPECRAGRQRAGAAGAVNRALACAAAPLNLPGVARALPVARLATRAAGASATSIPPACT